MGIIFIFCHCFDSLHLLLPYLSIVKQGKIKSKVKRYNDIKKIYKVVFCYNLKRMIAYIEAKQYLKTIGVIN